MPVQRLYDRPSTTGRGAVMKKFLFGGIALAAMVAAPAMAADMPIKAALQQPVAYYDWSGAYAGFNAGGAWYDVTHLFTTPGAITPNVTTNDRDAIFGFHAGAQWQWGAWVAGVEAALSGCFHECRSTSGVLPVAQGFEPNVFGEHKITNLFTVGPRLGYAWDRLMIFATGGWASANLKNAPLLVHHQSLRRPRVDRKRRVAQQRVVCGRWLRLHGAQGCAGRRGAWRRIPALRCERLAGVLRQPRLCGGSGARFRP